MPRRLDPRYRPLEAVLKLHCEVLRNQKLGGRTWPLVFVSRNFPKRRVYVKGHMAEGVTFSMTQRDEKPATLEASFSYLLTPMAVTLILGELVGLKPNQMLPDVVRSRAEGISKRKLRIVKREENG